MVQELVWNLPTIIVFAIVIALFLITVVKLILDRKAGKLSCGGNCGGCGGCTACHTEQKKLRQLRKRRARELRKTAGR